MCIFNEFPQHAGDGPDHDDFADEIRALCDSGEAFDDSWHNNECPSVAYHHGGVGAGGAFVILWDAGRDYHATSDWMTTRFSVMVCATDSSPIDFPDGALFEGDDPAEAVQAFRAACQGVALGGVGQRVRFRRDVHRAPRVNAAIDIAAGETGTVLSCTEDGVAVLLDTEHGGAPAWNQVCWWDGGPGRERLAILDDLEIVGAPGWPAIGSRVRFLRDVERYPHAIIEADEMGVVVHNTGLVGVKLDLVHPGLAEWDNVCWWNTPDDRASLVTALEVFPAHDCISNALRYTRPDGSHGFYACRICNALVQVS